MFARTLSMEYAKKCNADLLLATDPDCDRVGIAVKNKAGEYELLTGNQTGMLLLDYICSQRVKHSKMPADPAMVKTIVTMDMGEQIASHYGLRTINVLTGFKFIGEQIGKLEQQGKYESMVQRVYRQITTVDADAKITIATSKSQASAIKNQLGEKASICVEPCRRDTFPAIALAAAYLHDELGVRTDESVVVCPVDPYVDNTYYEAVKTLQELAEQGNANLTLMGIEPTYPSEKYGYIIPESGENVSKVKEFKEKPDVETAKKYLAQSALWNAGIFAFKLEYLLDKAHSMIDFEDYRDLFNKYDTLTKISFDYAVVEKESSIQVLRYSGDWKDVGTWNMMAEVMADKTKGKAILDETCVNTNVVNELNIPILCMGCKDMIIAASGDGILISDKERSGYMKPYVEKIETEAMYAEKSWGTYTVIDVQPGSMTVKISMKAGEKMSYHMHNEREEVWTVVSGKGKAVVDGMEQVLRTGDVITIAAGCKHTVEAITPLDMIEVQLGDEISVTDKIKFELD